MNEILEESQYRESLKSLTDRQVAEEAALQAYRVNASCIPCREQVGEHQKLLNRITGAIGILGIVVAAAVTALFAKWFK